MESNIAAEYYYSEKVFDKEKNNIYHNLWIFVGFVSDLTNNKDFISKTIGETPIVIQNFDGQIKAFLNVCSHRFATLQNEECGNRALTCPYHGWAYNSDGIPFGIPKKPYFKNFTSDELCKMKLKEFTVDFCGNLIFICLDTNPNSLKNQLGNFYDEIKTISLSANKKIDTNVIDINANWKIVVENTLESYHVNLVHSETLAKLKPSGLKFEFSQFNSSWESDINLDKNSPGYNKINEYYTPRQFDINGYKHILIFPNLLISSTHGISFNFSIIEPIRFDKTKFTSLVFITNSIKEKKISIIPIFEDSLINFNRKVFDEDKYVCQLVQNGVHHTTQIGMLSIEEERVHHFQKSYLKQLENEIIY